MNILFLGGKQAGCVGLLTVLALGHKVKIAVGYDPKFDTLARELGITVFNNIHDANYDMFGLDLIVSVHARQKVPDTLLKRAKHGGINVHPCLSKYSGESTSPITRLLQNKDHAASVGVHYMTSTIDGGPVIVEIPVAVMGKTENEIYNELYPFYSIALIEALETIK